MMLLGISAIRKRFINRNSVHYMKRLCIMVTLGTSRHENIFFPIYLSQCCQAKPRFIGIPCFPSQNFSPEKRSVSLGTLKKAAIKCDAIRMQVCPLYRMVMGGKDLTESLIL